MGFGAQSVAAYNITSGSYNTAIGYQAGRFVPNNSIQFNSAKDNAVLTITADGDVIWNGKPSEASKILVNNFQMAVEDAKGVTKAAKRRYYALACRNLLKAAEQMESEEFLAFLNREVYNREHRVIMDSLKGEYGQ